MPNVSEIILILLIIGIVFGFGKLSKLGQTAGKLKGSFKKGLDTQDEDPIDITPPEDSEKKYDGHKPGTREQPVEDADLEE